MWKKLKQLDYRHLLCLALVLGSVALGIFVYKYPFVRVGESLNDFGRALAYTVTDLIGIAERAPEQTVNEFSGVDLMEIFNIDASGIRDKLTSVWREIFVWENFASYLFFLLRGFGWILFYLCIAFLLVIPLALPVILSWESVNNDYNADTLPLRLFKRFVVTPCRSVFAWCKAFWHFFRESTYWGWFVAVWLLNLGVFTVIFSFLAYYFWMLTTLDFSTVGVQLLKLIADLLLAFHTLPLFCWLLFAALFCGWFFRRFALRVLRGMVAKTVETIAKLPMVIFLVGLPRSGKTTLLTALGLYFSILFRQTAQKLMARNVLKFPTFPWINLELEIRARVEDHTVWNFYTIRKWVDELQAEFEADPCREKIFDYDFEKERYEYDDHLQVIDIWTSIKNYSQEFFIYWLQSSMLVANYAVREDFVFHDLGNFPMLDTDFFSRDARDQDQISTMSHILDHDMLRRGVKMLEDNVRSGTLEFGIAMVSEGSQERQNTLQLQEVKAKAEECNQKNDLYEEDLQTRGHAATVENFCFFHFLIDSQRAEGWSAKGRELGYVLHISPKSGTRSALPFFWIINGLISRYLNWWEDGYWNGRYKWGNNRLITYILNGIASALYGYQLRRTNDFGFYRQITELESGKSGGHKEKLTLDMPLKVIYSRRFATDCFKAYTEPFTAECPVGLNDLPAYRALYPSFEELMEQHSHFFNKLFRYYILHYSEEENDERKE